MLVLTCKIDENIRINDNVKIVVLEVRQGQVKLGIEAPREVKVWRGKIFDQIQAEAQEKKRKNNDADSKPPPVTRPPKPHRRWGIFPTHRKTG